MELDNRVNDLSKKQVKLFQNATSCNNQIMLLTKTIYLANNKNIRTNCQTEGKDYAE